MEVTCERCQARYAFAADAIDAEGYQAQCSHCQHVFFVAPEKRPSHIDRLFEGDLHGEQALDAQGESLQNDTSLPPWLRAQAPQRPGPQPPDGSPPPRAPDAAPSAPPLSADERRQAIEREWAEAPLAKPGEPVQPRRRRSEPDDEQAGQTRDEPMAPADWAQSEDGAENAEAYRTRRRSLHRKGLAESARPMRPLRSRARAVVGAAATVVVGLGVVVGVVRSKSLHTPTQVTPPVRIVRDPSPAALEAFEAGVRALQQDTAASLLQAQQHFVRAASQDSDYTDAWAGAGLTAWLIGVDARQEELEQSARLHEDMQALTQAAQAQGRDASAVHLGQSDDEAASSAMAAQAALSLAASSLRLRSVVHEAQRRSEALQGLQKRLFAGLHDAGGALLVASQLPMQTPLLATAMALWHTDDPRADALVPAALAWAEQLVGQLSPPTRRSWSGEAPDASPAPQAAAPWAAWRQMARGRMAMRHADEQSGEDKQARLTEAIDAFERAMRLEPQARRAAFWLAQALIAAGRQPEGRRLLEGLAHGPQAHPRAQAALQRLSP